VGDPLQPAPACTGSDAGGTDREAGQSFIAEGEHNAMFSAAVTRSHHSWRLTDGSRFRALEPLAELCIHFFEAFARVGAGLVAGLGRRCLEL
jgi:hypothetical protein